MVANLFKLPGAKRNELVRKAADKFKGGMAAGGGGECVFCTALARVQRVDSESECRRHIRRVRRRRRRVRRRRWRRKTKGRGELG